jgi:hypothetical protein
MRKLGQKKYLRRIDIELDINAAQRKLNRIMTAARGEEEMMLLLKESRNFEYKTHEAALDKLLKKADRLKRTRMKKLQNALAAFLTQPLGIAGAEAAQVVLEKL